MIPTPQAIENVARSMEPRAFEAFDQGYTSQNYLDKRAFLNAEKVVKRARKKAALALGCDLGDMVLVPKEPSVERVTAAGKAVEKYVRKMENAGGEVDAFDYALRIVIYRAMIAAAEDER